MAHKLGKKKSKYKHTLKKCPKYDQMQWRHFSIVANLNTNLDLTEAYWMKTSLVTSSNSFWVFHKLYENANIGIFVFIVQREKKSSDKMLLPVGIEPWPILTSDFILCFHTVMTYISISYSLWKWQNAYFGSFDNLLI